MSDEAVMTEWMFVGALGAAVLVGFVLGWIAGQITLWRVGWRRPPYKRIGTTE